MIEGDLKDHDIRLYLGIPMYGGMLGENTLQAGSAIESFRNEMVKQNMTTLSTLMEGMDKKKLK